MPLVTSFRRFPPAPSLKEVFSASEVLAPVLHLPLMARAVPVDANVLLPVEHIDLMSGKAEVSPSIIPDVSVDVIDISDGLVASHQKEGNTVLKEGFIPKVDLLVSGTDRRSNQLSVLGKVIGMVNPPKLTRLWAVANSALKFTRYRLQFHVAIILFPQVMCKHG